jgi:hypothetical protein
MQQSLLPDNVNELYTLRSHPIWTDTDMDVDTDAQAKQYMKLKLAYTQERFYCLAITAS